MGKSSGMESLCGYRGRMRVNAVRGIALMYSLESWENPFSLNKGFCRIAKGKDVVKRLYFYLLGSYFDILTEGTM